MARALTALVVAGAAAILAACSSTGGSSVSKAVSGFFGGDRPDDIPPEYFQKRPYCPPVQVRAGTAVLVTYERGHDGDPDFVRHQASIGKTARECLPSTTGYSLKVGVAGRVVAGPKGSAGGVSLPLRVAVVRPGGEVLFSQLYKLPVELVPPDLGADFQQVIPQVDVPAGPDDKDLVIYIGFDEGKTG